MDFSSVEKNFFFKLENVYITHEVVDSNGCSMTVLIQGTFVIFCKLCYCFLMACLFVSAVYFAHYLTGLSSMMLI